MPEPTGERPADDGRDVSATTFVDALGGGRGLFDSAVPATVFVVTRLITDNLTTAIVVAVVAGLAIVALRRVRGQSLQQAGSGFFGLAIAVVIARATGKGEGFFLPGIVITAAMGVGFVLSLMVGRPAVGAALAAYDPKYAAWRDHPPLYRAARICTAVWAATFFIRAGIATMVYRREGDNDGLLLVVVNAVKWPLIIGAALLTVRMVRRAGLPEAAAAATGAAAAERAAEGIGGGDPV
ncbi:MAG: DUF3159 domain-containing protein [Frankiaceae bacterium]|nr:DUF3159 domain-containing protein [Frankiaceae bacterium]